MSVKEQTESKDSIEIKDKLTKISKKYGLLFPHKYDYVCTAYKHDAFILCCKPSSLSKSYMLYIYLERIVNLKSNSDTKTTCEPKQYHLIKITNQISSEEKISNLMLEIKKILEKSLCPGKELQTLYESNKNIILIKPQNLLYFRKLPKDCVNNPDSYLQPGDFVRVYLDGYKHAGVYIGNGKMIHVSSGLEGKILYTYQETVEKYARETTWDLFVEKRSNLDVGDFILPFRTQDDIVHSAKSFAYLEYGRGKYHVLNHNCEHFCWLCCTGEDKHELLVSPQVEDVKHAAKVGILSAAVTAIVAGAAALFITSSKKDKDKDKNKKAQKSVIKPTQDANNNDEDEKEKNPINERH